MEHCSIKWSYNWNCPLLMLCQLMHLLSGQWHHLAVENSSWSSLSRLLKVSNKTGPKWVLSHIFNLLVAWCSRGCNSWLEVVSYTRVVRSVLHHCFQSSEDHQMAACAWWLLYLWQFDILLCLCWQLAAEVILSVCLWSYTKSLWYVTNCLWDFTTWVQL